MAQELFLGIRLGVSGAAAIGAALGSANNAMVRLGDTARRLATEQQRLGDAIRRHMGQLAPSTLTALNRDYDRLGKAIDAVRIKQEQLGRAMARREALRDERARLSGEIMGAYGTALAVGAPVFGAVREAAGFGDAVKDIAIVGELSRNEEARLGASLRRVALAVNQTADDMARGVGLLIANGMEARQAAAQAELLGRFTTATRASFDDAARMMVSFSQLGVSADQMALAFSQAAKAGKLGSFEVRDMARWFPQLGGYMKAIGITGNEAVINMASRLQVAMKTAGSTDEAANNFRNFIAKLASPDTAKDFEKLGIDLQSSMLRLARQGLDPIEGAVGIIMQKVGQRAPQVTQELEALSREIAAIEDPSRRAAELERRRAMIEALGQRAGLGQMFQDMQAVGYLLAEIQNRDELKRIRAGVASGKTASGQMSLDADFGKRMESPIEQFKAMKIALSDMAMSVGDALLPALTGIVRTMKPVVLTFAEWAKAHPGIIKGVIGFAIGMAGVKAAVLSAGWAFNFLISSPLAALATGWQSLTARLLIGRAVMLAGAGPLKALGLVAGLSESAIGKLGAGLAKFGALAVTALTHAGRAVLWLGRAVMLNPIGLALSAAAFLVYKFWGPISGFFRGLWRGISGAMDGIGQALAPIGAAFSAAFAPVVPIVRPVIDILGRMVDGVRAFFKPLDDAGGAAERMGERIGHAVGEAVHVLLTLPARLIELPAKMMRLGGEIVAGLIRGIQDKLAAAGAAIGKLGETIKDKFKGWLGIRSPSRVFDNFGQMIGLGAAQGISGMDGAVARASAGLALAAATAFTPQLAAAVPAFDATRARVAQHAGTAHPAHGAAAGASITFAPVIHVAATGDKAAVAQQVQEGLRVSFAEFERLMRRHEAERRRLSPMGGLL